MLLAPEGHLLAAVDLSQIEPRVLNWLAGNHQLLQRIRDGFPIYEAHARDSMGWTGGTLKKENPGLYSLAKARCLAGDTLVLTELRGYVYIRKLLTTDRVWDGVEWVKFDAIIQQPDSVVVPKMGESATFDHTCYTPGGPKTWTELDENSAASLAAFRNIPTSEWHDVWKLACAVFRAAAAQWLLGGFVRMHRVWKDTAGRLLQPCRWKNPSVYPLRDCASPSTTSLESVGVCPHKAGADCVGTVESNKTAL